MSNHKLYYEFYEYAKKKYSRSTYTDLYEEWVEDNRKLVAVEKERDELRDSLKFKLDYTSSLEVARKDIEEEAIQRGNERDELQTRVELTDKAILSALGLIRDLENELIGIKNVAVKAIEYGDESRMKMALTAIKWAVESVIYDKEPENEQN